MFHLSWFLSRGYGPKGWRYPWGGNGAARWMMPDLFVDLARGMERACFDYLIIEDSSNLPYTYQGSHDVYLKYSAATPKLDPAVLIPYLAQATTRLGLIPTLSTTEYPPFLLARLVNSLDHVTEGRVGWNLVTGSNDGGAQNYGRPKQYPHDQRYDMADEFADLVTQLWDAWEPDAVVLDPDAPLWADGSKVRPINFEGQYYQCRGPLNAPRSPQGRPVICQAGGSPRGRQFASRWADTIIASANGIEAMKEFRRDIRARATAWGRNPDSIKVLFLINPVVDISAEAARERVRLEVAEIERHIALQVASISRTSGIDFSKFGLDEPLPALISNGHQSTTAAYAGRTLRSIVTRPTHTSGLDLVGTVDQVAGRMQTVMQEVGGDGFLLSHADFNRRYIAEITDGLVPELQRRGLTKSGYSYRTFRENLLEF
jgi:FMN-dependent oxidoreductase (nitrilotriacetate monooxygenase family)